MIFFSGVLIIMLRTTQVIWVLLGLELMNLSVLFFISNLLNSSWVILLLSVQVCESVILLSLMVLFYRMM